jgi:sugar lactone lactonase YvrE
MPWLVEPWRLDPIDGGDSRALPFSAPALPVAWGEDGRTLYVTDLGTYRTARNIYRQDVASGRRQLWKTLAPSDPAGLESIGPVVLTPDGSCYCYTYVRTLGTLYVVEGLR